MYGKILNSQLNKKFDNAFLEKSYIIKKSLPQTHEMGFQSSNLKFSVIKDFNIKEFGQNRFIKKNQNFNTYQISYLKLEKKFFIIFLSEYLSKFLKNYLKNSNIYLNIQLINELDNNINILGKFLSKELISNPRSFKVLLKPFIKG